MRFWALLNRNVRLTIGVGVILLLSLILALQISRQRERNKTVYEVSKDIYSALDRGDSKAMLDRTLDEEKSALKLDAAKMAALVAWHRNLTAGCVPEKIEFDGTAVMVVADRPEQCPNGEGGRSFALYQTRDGAKALTVYTLVEGAITAKYGAGKMADPVAFHRALAAGYRESESTLRKMGVEGCLVPGGSPDKVVSWADQAASHERIASKFAARRDPASQPGSVP